MNGLFIINKKAGCTSRDVVNDISRMFHDKKVGHTGTLDPLASGVLLICIGRATKLVDYLTFKDKEYIAEVELGTQTDTLDKDGNIIKEEIVDLTDDEIIYGIKNMKGTYMQEVPKYSACKINGKKLYEYARENIDIKLPKREVTIYDISLVSDIVRKNNKINFKIKCLVSKGTYIRSLINDLASSLNTIGIMNDLIRTKQGKYKIEDAKYIDEISENDLISAYDIIDDIKKIIVDDTLKKDILNGKIIKNIYDEDKVLFVTNDKKVLAIYKTYQKDADYLKPDIMLGGI